MERGLLLRSDTPDWRSMARRAADRGYDTVWAAELWGADAFVRLATIAATIPELRLGTAIANVFSRSPAVLAMAAASLQEVSDRGFVLGTGVTTPKAVEDLHGGEFDRPVARAAETIQLVRRFLSDATAVDFAGDIYSVSDFPGLSTDVPVYHAALGPANRAVVGRHCDGWIPHNIPFTHLDEAFAVVADAVREADRDPADIAVAPYVPAAVDPDIETARDAIRGHVAYYVGSAAGYERAVATAFPDEASTVAAAWQSGDRDAARAAVSDEMVEALGVAATPDTAEDRFDALLREAPVDHAIVVVPPALDEAGITRTIDTLAP